MKVPGVAKIERYPGTDVGTAVDGRVHRKEPRHERLVRREERVREKQTVGVVLAVFVGDGDFYRELDSTPNARSMADPAPSVRSDIEGVIRSIRDRGLSHRSMVVTLGAIRQVLGVRHQLGSGGRQCGGFGEALS
jgi:hypothetical protein